MKKLSLLILGLLSFEAVALDWRLPRFNLNLSNETSGGLRAVWSCPSENRGEMPAEREVQIYYNENGEMKFRPDIFRKGFNPISAIKGLFGNKKDASDVDECLRSFLLTVPQTIAEYQRSQCAGSSDLVCTRSSNDVATDVGRSIRGSSFYRKYESELRPVASLLPEPSQTSRPVVTETKPAVEPVKTNTESAQPKEENPDRARTRLLDYMIDNYSKFNDLKEFARFCPDLGNTQGANAAYCSDRMTRNNQFLNNLSMMFTAARGESVPVTKVLESLDCLPTNANEFKDIEDILHRLDRRDDCSPLTSVGDYKLFSKSNKGPSSWYTSGNYLLKKTADNAYEATLNLSFVNAGGKTSPAEMMNIVRNCLATSSRFLRGPGGASLAIKALTPEEAEAIPKSERPAVDKIDIRTEGTEINSTNFGDNISCPTVTHEILHHLGLCDEYKEGRTNLVSGMTRSRAEEWSCRVVPKGPSIMKNHIEAYDAAVPQQMTCECLDESCRNAMAGMDAKNLAYRKLLMTSSPYAILGNRSNLCPNPLFLASVADAPEPDKAFVDVRVSGGTLTFQQRNVFSSSKGYSLARRNVTCTCPADDAECPAAFERAAQIMREQPQADNCPFNMKQVGQKTIAPEGAVTKVNPNSFNLVTIPKRSSLLSTSQFDKILTGSCMSTPSAMFKRCAEFAYTSTDSSACRNKPAECNDDSQYFGTEAQ